MSNETREYKLPPQSLDAEMSILGGILIDNDAVNRVLEYIVLEDFYRNEHRKIFSSMMQLSARQEPCDLVTLSETLIKKGELDDVGGKEYLLMLVDFVPTSANIAYYCKIVKERAVRRKLIGIATDIVSRSYDDRWDVNEVLGKALKNLADI